MSGPRPLAIIYAGCNGAGKSTLRRIEEGEGFEPRVAAIDPDIAAREINPAAPRLADIAAARRTLGDTQRAIASKTSFSLETTLAGHGVFSRIQQARTAGFWFRLIYVGLDSADIAIERVAARARRGGHDISSDVVRRRYVDSLRGLPKPIVLADEAVVFDNSQRFCEHYRKTRGQLFRVSVVELPQWLTDLEQRVKEQPVHPSVHVKHE